MLATWVNDLSNLVSVLNHLSWNYRHCHHQFVYVYSLTFISSFLPFSFATAFFTFATALFYIRRSNHSSSASVTPFICHFLLPSFASLFYSIEQRHQQELKVKEGRTTNLTSFIHLSNFARCVNFSEKMVSLTAYC